MPLDFTDLIPDRQAADGDDEGRQKQASLARNKTWTRADAKDFTTKLDPGQEAKFQAWVKANKVPFDPGVDADYDMRGYWKASQDPNVWKQLQQGGKIPEDMQPAGTKIDPNDGRPHYPDWWKTPYHETFSNESQWADPAKAPRWNDKDQLVAPDGKVVFDDKAQNEPPSARSPAALSFDGLIPDRKQQPDALPDLIPDKPRQALSFDDLMAPKTAYSQSVLGAPFNRISDAAIAGAKEGYGTGEASPEVQAANALATKDLGALAPVVHGINWLSEAGGRPLNALYRGAQGGIVQLATELGMPRLGRDLAAVPEAFAGMPEALRTPEQVAPSPGAGPRMEPRFTQPTGPEAPPAAPLAIAGPTEPGTPPAGGGVAPAAGPPPTAPTLALPAPTAPTAPAPPPLVRDETPVAAAPEPRPTLALPAPNARKPTFTIVEPTPEQPVAKAEEADLRATDFMARPQAKDTGLSITRQEWDAGIAALVKSKGRAVVTDLDGQPHIIVGRKNREWVDANDKPVRTVDLLNPDHDFQIVEPTPEQPVVKVAAPEYTTEESAPEQGAAPKPPAPAAGLPPLVRDEPPTPGAPATETERLAAQHGVDPAGLTHDQFHDQLAENASPEAHAAEHARIADEHAQAYEDAEKAATDWVVYHGTPHEFDQFDIDKIGTGEGAQAFGHGLYFAEHEDVATGYRNQLSGKSYFHTWPIEEQTAAGTLNYYGGDRDRAIAQLENNDRPEAAAAAELLRRGWEEPKDPGHLYTVRIKAKPEEMLDWDKPLSEQPAVVKKLIPTGWFGRGARLPDGERGDPAKLRGEDLYRSMKKANGGDVAASEALRAAGIKGIRYLDRGSRSDGEGTRNVVVFHHGDVEITHRNGVPTHPIYDRDQNLPPEAEEHEFRQGQDAQDAQQRGGGGQEPEPAGAHSGDVSEGGGQVPDTARDARRSGTEEGEGGEQAPDLTNAHGGPWTEIGKNHQGETVYENPNGVRATIENGVPWSEATKEHPERGRVPHDEGNRPERVRVVEPPPVESAEPAATKRDNPSGVPIGAQGGFPTFEAARNDLKARGFSSAGPYAKEWTSPSGQVFVIGGGIAGKTGQSARGARWTFGYYPKDGAEPPETTEGITPEPQTPATSSTETAPEEITPTADPQTPAKTRAPRQKREADPYETVPKEPKRLIQFLREPTVVNQGTIHEQAIPGGIRDVGGDVKAALGGSKGRPGLINNAAGRHLDDATLRAWEAGYFPEHDQRPEINDLLNAIREDHEGIPRYSVHDQEAIDAHHGALGQNSEIDRLAAQYDVPTRGLTREQFFDRLAERLEQQSLEEAAKHHAEVDTAAESARNEVNRALNDWNPNEAYGSDLPRTLEDLENDYRQEDVARTAREGGQDTEGRGRAASPEGAGEEGAGHSGSGDRPSGRDGAPGRAGEGDRRDVDLLGASRRTAPAPRAPEFTIHDDPTQAVMPGMEQSARQAQAARDAAPPRSGQKAADEGLFAQPETVQSELAVGATPAPKPVVDLRGDQIAPLDVDLKTLRQAARQYYEGVLRGTRIRSEALGRDVEFRNAKKAFSTSANPDKLRLFAALPEVIAKGALENSRPPRDPSIEPTTRAYHFLTAPVEMDGKSFQVGVMIREDANGHLYYNHNSLEDEGSPDPRPAGPRRKGGPGTGSGAVPGQDVGIPQRGVNLHPRQPDAPEYPGELVRDE